jgi:hypothetical protein
MSQRTIIEPRLELDILIEYSSTSSSEQQQQRAAAAAHQGTCHGVGQRRWLVSKDLNF